NLTFVDPIAIGLDKTPKFVCTDSTITLRASTGYDNYTWTNGPTGAGNTFQITDRKTGYYKVSVKKSECTASDSVLVTFVPVLDANLNLKGKKFVCENEDVELKAGDDFDDYTWFPGNGSLSSFKPPRISGTYVVLVHKYGCPKSDSVQLQFVDSLNVDLGPPTKYVCSDSIITLNAGAGFDRYEWRDGPKGASAQLFPVRDRVSKFYHVTVSSNTCSKSDSIFLNFVPELDLKLKDKQFVCSDSTVTLTANTGFDFYLWSDSIRDDNTYVPPRKNGVYKLTATKFGCPKSDSTNLIFVPEIPIGKFVPGKYCWNDSATALSAFPSKGYEIRWNGIVSNDSVYKVNKSETITLRKTDKASECYKEASVAIDFVPMPDFDIKDTTICPERSLRLSAQNPLFSKVTWQDTLDSDNLQLNAGRTGLYFFTAFTKNGDCKFTDSVSVRNFRIDSLDLGYDEDDTIVVCSYDKFTLHAGPLYKEYTWFPGSSKDSTFVPISSGPQQVNIVDYNGCQQTDLMIVTINKVDKPDLGPDTTICPGVNDYVLLVPNNRNLDILWSNGSKNSQYKPVPGDSVIWVNISRVLNKKICYSGDTVALRVAKPFNLSLGGDRIVCLNDSFSLDPKQDFSKYRWEFTAKKVLTDVGDSFKYVSDKKTLEPRKTGNYRLIVSGEFECLDSNTVNIDYYDYTPPMLSNKSICKGDTFRFEGGLNFDSYTWMKNNVVIGKDSVLKATEAGLYTLVVKKEACNLTDKASVELEVRKLPTIDRFLPSDTTLCFDVSRVDRLFINAQDTSYSYNWYMLPDTTILSKINVVDLRGPGAYLVNVTDTTGCTYRDTARVNYNNACFEIPNLITVNNDNRNETFFVEGIVANTWDLTVFNRWGDKVYYGKGYNNDWSADNVNEGVYFYQFENPKTKETYKGWLEILGK
ncbi:MAG TPA: gliding motility-associated C-terminal domain-containing protein, partial [Cytophagaceae bacterium]